MRNSQSLTLELSEKRSELADVTSKLNKAASDGTDPSQEDIGKADSLTREIRSCEVRFRAAALAEEQEDREARFDGGIDPETRELRGLETRSRIGTYFTAAAEGRAVEGAERELNEHMKIPLNKFPLRMLAPPATETRAETDIDTATNMGSWLDRLFAGTAAQRLGITMRAVPAGIAAYPVTTTGTTPTQRGRSQAVGDAAWVIGVTTMEPSRHGARAVFNIEDAARVPMLEEALQRDLRMALVESMDKAMLVGNSDSDENAIADIVGLQTAADVVEQTVTQALKVTLAGALGVFGDFVDGKHAASVEDLGIVLSVGAHQLWFKQPANTGAATTATIAQAMRDSGVNWMARAGIDGATGNGKFGGFVGRQRGIDGAGVAAVWESGELIRDPYTNAATGQVAMTLTALWNFKLPRATNFGRIKFVT